MGRKNRNQNNQQQEGAPAAQENREEGNAGTPSEENKEDKNSKDKKDVIVLKVNIHCEGCAAEISKCLRGFEGVEEVTINSNDSRVIVKGKNADPLKIVKRVEKKCNKHVELISPKPKPADKNQNNKKEDDDEPLVMIVVLQVYMHCENCAQEIKRNLLRMKEVQMVEPDLKNSQVTVTGAVDPQKIVEYLYKRAGKHAVIVKQEPQDKEKARKRAEKKKGGEKKEEATKNDNKKEEKKDFYYHYPPQYSLADMYSSQMFSDENVNSCSVM